MRRRLKDLAGMLLLLLIGTIAWSAVDAAKATMARGGQHQRMHMRRMVSNDNAHSQAGGNLTHRFVRDCSDAPSASIQHTCIMMRTMDTMVRARLKRQSSPNAVQWQQPIPVPPNSRGQTAYHPYDCMTLQCLCPFFGGRMQAGNCILANGSPLAMAYRKEYRMMTEDERARWHAALTALKRSGEYDRISAEHLSVGTASGAHSGPAFLPWHREYLKRLEIALRLVDPSVAIPYWDSVMDSYLPDPRDSILFSVNFAGETDFYGNVVYGPFAYWRTLEGRNAILRQLGYEGQLFTEAQINAVVAQNSVEYVLAYTAPQGGCPYPNNYGAVEYVHSNIHLWMGGDMKPPTTSANEPIFFMHHSFVDLMWELWRQYKQNRWSREVLFTPDVFPCTNAQHFSYAPMRPFPGLYNRDGLSNAYTDQMYRYAPRATCSVQNPNCGSRWLFCDTRGYPHCVSKVKTGGQCRGFEQFDVCAAGRCWYGRCVASFRAFRMHAARTVHMERQNATLHDHLATHLERHQQEHAQRSLVTSERRVGSGAAFVACHNRHPCCEEWARSGKCKSQDAGYMGVHCQAACRVCTPSYNATAGCADRHPMCADWAARGWCAKAEQKDMLAENCRASCSLCHVDKAAQCRHFDKVLDVPMSRRQQKVMVAALAAEKLPPNGLEMQREMDKMMDQMKLTMKMH